MQYILQYTRAAVNDLADLPTITARRIYKKLNWFIEHEPLDFAKPLHNSSLGQYRFRVGDYRVIFDVDVKGTMTILVVLRVKHRREVYRDL